MKKRKPASAVKGSIRRVRGLEREHYFKCELCTRSRKLSRKVTFRGRQATEYYYEYQCKFARIEPIVVIQYSLLREIWIIVSPENINELIK